MEKFHKIQETCLNYNLVINMLNYTEIKENAISLFLEENDKNYPSYILEDNNYKTINNLSLDNEKAFLNILDTLDGGYYQLYIEDLVKSEILVDNLVRQPKLSLIFYLMTKWNPNIFMGYTEEGDPFKVLNKIMNKEKYSLKIAFSDCTEAEYFRRNKKGYVSSFMNANHRFFKEQEDLFGSKSKFLEELKACSLLYTYCFGKATEKAMPEELYEEAKLQLELLYGI